MNEEEKKFIRVFNIEGIQQEANGSKKEESVGKIQNNQNEFVNDLGNLSLIIQNYDKELKLLMDNSNFQIENNNLIKHHIDLVHTVILNLKKSIIQENKNFVEEKFKEEAKFRSESQNKFENFMNEKNNILSSYSRLIFMFLGIKYEEIGNMQFNNLSNIIKQTLDSSGFITKELLQKELNQLPSLLLNGLLQNNEGFMNIIADKVYQKIEKYLKEHLDHFEIKIKENFSEQNTNQEKHLNNSLEEKLLNFDLIKNQNFKNHINIIENNIKESISNISILQTLLSDMKKNEVSQTQNGMLNEIKSGNSPFRKELKNFIETEISKFQNGFEEITKAISSQMGFKIEKNFVRISSQGSQVNTENLDPLSNNILKSNCNLISISNDVNDLNKVSNFNQGIGLDENDKGKPLMQEKDKGQVREKEREKDNFIFQITDIQHQIYDFSQLKEYLLGNEKKLIAVENQLNSSIKEIQNQIQNLTKQDTYKISSWLDFASARNIKMSDTPDYSKKVEEINSQMDDINEKIDEKFQIVINQQKVIFDYLEIESETCEESQSHSFQNKIEMIIEKKELIRAQNIDIKLKEYYNQMENGLKENIKAETNILNSQIGKVNTEFKIFTKNFEQRNPMLKEEGKAFSNESCEKPNVASNSIFEKEEEKQKIFNMKVNSNQVQEFSIKDHEIIVKFSKHFENGFLRGIENIKDRTIVEEFQQIQDKLAFFMEICKKKCHSCLLVDLQNDKIGCFVCKKILCRSCTVKCIKCRNILCKQDSKKCTLCNIHYCLSCISFSNKPDSIHDIYCNYCAKIYCFNCMIFCEICKTLNCKQCLSHCFVKIQVKGKFNKSLISKCTNYYWDLHNEKISEKEYPIILKMLSGSPIVLSINITKLSFIDEFMFDKFLTAITNHCSLIKFYAVNLEILTWTLLSYINKHIEGLKYLKKFYISGKEFKECEKKIPSLSINKYFDFKLEKNEIRKEKLYAYFQYSEFSYAFKNKSFSSNIQRYSQGGEFDAD